MVILRLHLDQVEADERDTAQPADQPQGIPAGRSADFGGPGARGEAGIDEIDVEREEDRAASDALPNLRQHIVDTALQQLLSWNQVKSERPRRTPILGSIER